MHPPHRPLREVLETEPGRLSSSDWACVDSGHLELFAEATYITERHMSCERARRLREVEETFLTSTYEIDWEETERLRGGAE